MDWTSELRKPFAKTVDGRRVTLAEALTTNRADIVHYKLASTPGSAPRPAIKDRRLQMVDPKDIEIDFGSPNKFTGTHGNLVPMQSAVAGARVFYGARFYNQALPVLHPEAPHVQALVDDDPQGRSFDEMMGNHAGIRRSPRDGKVSKVSADAITLTGDDGKEEALDIYNKFPMNRKTVIHSTPVVHEGDAVRKGDLLAHSNFTDPKGTLAIGLNARTALVPFRGHSMDDAVVVSESFAKRLTSGHSYAHDLDYKRGVKGGKAHYTGVFVHKFVNDQLDKLDDAGVVKVGQTLHPGDPVILATRPRVISSTNAQLGLLSKHMKNARSDASVLWDHDTPGTVTDVTKVHGGVKVNIESQVPTQVGDKICYRTGQKGIISHIIPDDQMPRTVDGKPLEVLLNHLGIPSRVNSALVYELALGKIAEKTGQPYKMPAFNKPGEKWHEIVEQELRKNGMTDKEEVFDPVMGRKLENPIMVGSGYVLKLHHTSASKIAARGQGAYDVNQQPLHGGDDSAQSKRLSGLETGALLSSGAYGFLREGATLRGSKNDEYWRMLRQGHEPKEPGTPFVWDKFKALLTGSGYLARKLPGGRERLQFYTDKDLDKAHPIEVRNGELVDLGTMEPTHGGLFDPALTGGNSWGYIKLPSPLPNPAAEDAILKLLGLTEKQYRAIIAGEQELPEHLRKHGIEKGKGLEG